MIFEDVQFADFTCRLNTSDCLPCYSQATHSRITYGTVSARHHGRMQDEVRRTQTKREERGAARPPKHSEFYSWEAEKKVAGWVARTRPLAEPLSPRGPQPVLQRLRTLLVRLNGSAEPLERVPE